MTDKISIPEGLSVGPIMNERYLDGTIRYGAKASWRSSAYASTTVSVSGKRSYEEACAAVVEQARLFGFKG